MRYGRTILSTLDLEQIQQLHLGAIADVVGADAHGIYVVERKSYEPLAIATSGAPRGFVSRYRELGHGRDPFFLLARELDRPVHDRMLVGRPGFEGANDLLRSHGFRHAMLAPLVYGEVTLGTVNFARVDRPFDACDVLAAKAAIDFAGAAVGHALAYRGPGELGPPAERRSFHGHLPALTAREIEVLEHVAAGLRNDEIAGALTVTIHTVKQHLKNIYRKLGASSRTDALRRASAASALAVSGGGDHLD